MNAIDVILNIKNPEYKNEYQFQEEVYNIAKYIISQQYKLNEFRQESLKRLLPQVISLTKNAYGALYPPKGLYVTDKADGKRCIVIIRDGMGILMTNNKIIKYIPLVKPDDADCMLDTILDCEYIEHPSSLEEVALEVDGGGENECVSSISGNLYAFDIIDGIIYENFIFIFLTTRGYYYHILNEENSYPCKLFKISDEIVNNHMKLSKKINKNSKLRNYIRI
jgi:hypothetical protein